MSAAHRVKGGFGPLFAFCLLIALACAGAVISQGHAAPLQNRLAGHASPYLAQHGADPVAWQEWNAETLARARRENKLLFVSVGYFACHWCHVMQRESYRDPAIAGLLNREFIPVKVDRELNGALDAALIAFVERLKGVSGWPLNAFITPEGYPAYAVLYEPASQFKTTLQRLARAWHTQGPAFAEAAREAVPPVKALPAREAWTPDAVARQERAFLAAARAAADALQGGFSRISKFPMAAHLTRLLEIQARQPDAELAAFLRLSLDHMAERGLRDAVNGGFFRYTTDPDWLTPHFEKMLADNAQLALLYARAAQVLARPDYRDVAHDTLDFMLRFLRAPEGGYYTALSALDDQGREGGAYLWSTPELRAQLTRAQFESVRRFWHLDTAAPFAAGWLPQRTGAVTPAERSILASALQRLRVAGRANSVPRDQKINAGLNGLALSALSRAGQGEARFERAAHDLRRYLEQAFVQPQGLVRTRAGKRVFTQAEVDDHAYLAAGLLDYALTFEDTRTRALAMRLVREAWPRYFNPSGWLREAQPLLAGLPREPALADAALPSPSMRLIEVTRALTQGQADAGLQTAMQHAREIALPLMRQEPFDFLPERMRE